MAAGMAATAAATAAENAHAAQLRPGMLEIVAVTPGRIAEEPQRAVGRLIRDDGRVVHYDLLILRSRVTYNGQFVQGRSIWDD